MSVVAQMGQQVSPSQIVLWQEVKREKACFLGKLVLPPSNQVESGRGNDEAGKAKAY